MSFNFSCSECHKDYTANSSMKTKCLECWKVANPRQKKQIKMTCLDCKLDYMTDWAGKTKCLDCFKKGSRFAKKPENDNPQYYAF